MTDAARAEPTGGIASGAGEVFPHLRHARLTPAACIGAAAAMLTTPLLPRLKPLFAVPSGGIGFVTAAHYPKGWDYAIVAILAAVAAVVSIAAAALLPKRERTAGRDAEPLAFAERRPVFVWIVAAIVAVAMFPARDEPYGLIDPFHDGEILTPASVLMAGGAPYRDVFFAHGLATDGGLDVLAMGTPPHPLRARRVKAVLSALTLALLVPIAAEVTITAAGTVGGVIASLCALAAGELPAFPYFRLLPLLLMVWLVLRFVRTGLLRNLVVAAAAASAGLLWSADIGMFAVAGFWIWLLARPLLGPARGPRVGRRFAGALAVITLVTPLVLLVLTRSGIGDFVRDTFRRYPEAVDAVFSLPAPPLAPLATFASPAELWKWLASPAGRYCIPPVAYGLMIVAALVFAARRQVTLANAALLFGATGFLHFRVAAGRVSWSHSRFSVPLLGIALVAFAVERLIAGSRSSGPEDHPALRNRVVAAVFAGLLVAVACGSFELAENARYLGKYWSTYASRLRPPADRAPYDVPRLRGMYTYPQDAADARALYLFSQSMPPGPIFDYSGEQAVYYALGRPPATRCQNVPYLSNPKLGAEARQQLERHPPVFVIISGLPKIGDIDGIGSAERTPWLAKWIDERYPRRTRAGRYELALPAY